MTSNGGAPNPWRPPPPQGGYPCPLCGKWWPTVQALGGHMSSRTCVKKRRRQEDAPVSQPLPVPTIPVCALRGPLLLGPNHFFWAEYRNGGRPPVEINFLRLPGAPVAQPVMEHHDAEPQVNNDGDGEEIDLTLKL